MRVGVVNTCVPFVSGGAEHLAAALRFHLSVRGHEAILIRIPFRWYPTEHVIDHILACRLMCLKGVDRVIALKFPAYCLPHDDKVLWLLHQFRQAYDLWGTRYQDIPDTPEGLNIRRTIMQSDNEYLPEAKRIYTNSHVTSNRLKTFNGLDSEVLYPPLERSEHFQCSEYGDFIFYPSRVTDGKRQALVVEAMRHCRTNVRLVIGGLPELSSDREKVERAIQEGKLEGRVTFLPRFLSEAEKAQYFAEALGCAYTPFDEDSYGYVTLEAYHSRKPVITCSDSGGTSILVKHGETGLVAEPSPESLGEAMDRLYAGKKEARKMGEAGYALMQSLGINWDTVVQRLTS